MLLYFPSKRLEQDDFAQHAMITPSNPCVG